MPDPIIPEPSERWKEIITAVKELAIVIGAVSASIFAGIGQCQGKKNGDEIQVVTQKVDATADKVAAVEVKADALNATATKAADKAEKTHLMSEKIFDKVKLPN